jgi:hypothetical protein
VRKDVPEASRPAYAWWWKSRLPERRGQPCFVTARGKMNTVRVEFLDAFVVFTSRYAVRRIRQI